MEVGHKQKSAVTRSSGAIEIESPVTKIFGGKLRSELRVPGLKNSVTLEPYQPLQLDIGAPDVHNIIDALKGLTHSETLHGDFNSPRGPGTSATKQVFIETLPPVLILHLKRFQYDNTGGTQKIWKKVGYPLDLEIPKEVFPPHKRNTAGTAGGAPLPRYRLTAVVYHHGKNASGGHYTVDVRRQEGREWIRLDDTLIRRIRADDVARAGAEEDPRALAAALEAHGARAKELQQQQQQQQQQQSASQSRNYYELAGLDDEDEEESEREGGWKEVVANGAVPAAAAAASASTAATTATPATGKKWSGVVVNGAATPSSAASAGKKTPPKEKTSVKDNKVAYILFYEQVAA
jgi:ubiquitin carboxyl-terminal hydrolase 10